MAAVSVSKPLCQPFSYDDKFKVELHVKKPLVPVHLSPQQVGVEMLCLCGQLDLLIRAQVHQFQEQLMQDCSPEESDTFQGQADSDAVCSDHTGRDIIDQMLHYLEHLPKPLPQLEDYLDIVGLSAIFPRVEVFLLQGSPVDMLEKPLMDEYYCHISRLNQLLVLSQQLQEDIKHLGSHKYITHQLSVIYVISFFSGIQPLWVLKKDIERNFKQLKLSLVPEEGSRQEPLLSAHYMSWILEVLETIMSTVSSLPEELMEDLNPVLTFISQLSS